MRALFKSGFVFFFFIINTVIVSGQNSINKPDIIVQSGHSKQLATISVSADGKTVISGAEDRMIILWDIASGKELRTFKGHTDDVISVAFSPDGKNFLSGSKDNTLKLWNTENGTELKTFTGNTSWVKSVAFSPDGKTAISSSLDYSIKLWDIDSGKEIRTFLEENSAAKSLAFSPNGKTFLSGSYDKTVKLWDVALGQILRSYKGHSKSVNSVAFSPDGKIAASGSEDNTIIIWNVESGKKIKQIKGTDYINSVAFSPDGNKLISGGDDSNIHLWDITSGIEIKSFHSSNTCNVSILPDGKTAISADIFYTIKLWNIENGNLIKAIQGNPANVSSVKFSPDRKTILSGSGNQTLNLWDFASGKEIRVFKGHTSYVTSIAFSPDGKTAVSGSTNFEIKRWNIESGKEVNSYKGLGSYPLLNDLAFSPNGEMALMTYNNLHNLTLWDVSNVSRGVYEYKVYNIKPEKDDYLSLPTFSPDGKSIIVRTGYEVLNLLDKESGNVIQTFRGHTSNIYCVAFSIDGKTIISGYADNTLKLWDIANGNEIKTFRGQHIFTTVNAVAFTPDGKNILVGSDDFTLTLWDIANGNVIRTFAGHFDAIKSIAISTDGKYAVTGGRDNIKLWNVSTGELIYTSIANADGSQWIVYDDEGHWDASPNGGDLVAMVQGMDVWNIDQFAVKNNRPDIIMKKLPDADPELINHYYNQYLKRLKKLKLTENKLSKDFETPETKITKSTQNGKNIKIDFTITSKTAKVTRYNIFVNDVPIFGAYGTELAASGSNNSNSFPLTETFELITGDNKIEVSAMNEFGAESFRALTYANYLPAAPIKTNLYFIGFGVSKYQNTTLNLQYADKDAANLAEALGKMKDNYNNVYINTFSNEQVTVENIIKAKELLKNAKPDDTFILFIAGHGMHDSDKEATYYYLTYNTDIKNLKGTAADFETIEDLLQGIPPRNKLFLMDACESGEIDDEDQGQMMVMATGAGINSRGFKKSSSSQQSAVKSQQTAVGSQQAPKRSYLYQKDRYIYNDLVRRSGAIVFSSSKGGELSYERSDIENGLFTEYIMKALATTEADKDGNGTVSTDELRVYVSEQVAKASGDLQHPTVDRDNIYQKFGFGVK